MFLGWFCWLCSDFVLMCHDVLSYFGLDMFFSLLLFFVQMMFFWLFLMFFYVSNLFF